MNIGQNFELIINGKFSYQANVVNLSDEGILLAVDIFEKRFNVLAGETVRARISENGSIKEFELEIRKIIKSTNLLLTGYPKTFQNIQRRRYYRIKVWEDFSVRYSEKDIHPTPVWLKLDGLNNIHHRYSKDYKSAHLLDLSAQGLAFLSNKPLRKGKKIGLILDFMNPPIKAVAQVIRCIGEEKPFKVSVEMKLGQLDSNRLMKIIFEKESAMLATRSMTPRPETFSKLSSFNLSKSKNKIQEEARKAFRLSNIAIPIYYKVVCHYLDIAQQNYSYAVLRNISFTGASFITENKIDDHSEVWVKMKIGGHDIRLLGHSLRSRMLKQINKHEIGLKFQAIDVSSSKKLISFIYYQHRLQNLELSS